MPVSKEFANYVIEQLHALGSIASRRMFGGVGIYCDDIFFALISRDTLYFKTDASNRSAFLARGMQPFRPTSDFEVSYFEVPADALEDPDELLEWARPALGAALRTRQKPKRKKKSRVVSKTRPRRR